MATPDIMGFATVVVVGRLSEKAITHRTERCQFFWIEQIGENRVSVSEIPTDLCLMWRAHPGFSSCTATTLHS